MNQKRLILIVVSLPPLNNPLEKGIYHRWNLATHIALDSFFEYNDMRLRRGFEMGFKKLMNSEEYDFLRTNERLIIENTSATEE